MNVESMLLAVFVAVICYFGGMALVDRIAPRENYKKSMLNRIRNSRGDAEVTESLLRDTQSSNPIVRSIFSQPGMDSLQRKIVHAGLEKQQAAILPMLLVLLLATTALVLKMMPPQYQLMALPGGFIMTYLITKVMLGKMHERRMRVFLDQFPDALDMMVRSVKSGYPMQSSLQMVSENMSPPISTEFKRLVEELAYGRPFSEALKRMGERVNQTDLKFFTVVLAVQQETGGNLSEVLTTLSRVLRSRKQLRLKVRALTSEGRATMWIMSSLPVVLFGIISWLAPQHMEPLYTSGQSGYMVLGIAVGLVVTGITIVSQMIKIEV